MRQRTGGNSISPARASISSRPRHTTSRKAPLACFQSKASHNCRDSFQRLLSGCSRMNSLRKAICSRSMVCPRYRHVSASGITAECQKRKQNASLLLWVISTYFSPHRRGFYLRIARRQQQLRLVRLQYPRRFGARRPPLEPSFGQSLRRQPEPLAIVLQDSDGRSTTGAENEQVTGK